ncbi:MAG TPA: hypothetical protein VKA51_11485 [Rubrobacteraceae bacterium]|nr:hypothetical protein [Rubrobacteraceae bacterium]
MMELTPQAFAEKWARSKLSERSASHQHFLDLCQMLGAAVFEVSPQSMVSTLPANDLLLPETRETAKIPLQP